MRTLFVFLGLSLFISISPFSYAQSLDKTAEWDQQCAAQGCVFFYDLFHESAGEKEAITISIAVRSETKKIAFLSIHYPPQAGDAKNAFFVFAKSSNNEQGYLLTPIKSTLTDVKFEYCDEESCVARILPDSIKKYDLQQFLLDNSHLFFLYKNKGKLVRAMAPLYSFQTKFNAM